MDDDTKAFIAVMVVMAILSLGACYGSYLSYKQSQEAMTAGYEQVIEDHRILWKKAAKAELDFDTEMEKLR